MLCLTVLAATILRFSGPEAGPVLAAGRDHGLHLYDVVAGAVWLLGIAASAVGWRRSG